MTGSIRDLSVIQTINELCLEGGSEDGLIGHQRIGGQRYQMRVPLSAPNQLHSCNSLNAARNLILKIIAKMTRQKKEPFKLAFLEQCYVITRRQTGDVQN